MNGRSLLALALIAAAVPAPSPAQARPADQRSTAAPAQRAIRRDIPLTIAIRRAFAAGTRDSTGRPGRNYWQLGVDYTITARLDPATSRITGTETVVIRNDSDS